MKLCLQSDVTSAWQMVPENSIGIQCQVAPLQAAEEEFSDSFQTALAGNSHILWATEWSLLSKWLSTGGSVSCSLPDKMWSNSR